MNKKYLKIIISLLLVPIMAAIGLDGPWMVIPALIFLSAFSNKSDEIGELGESSNINGKGLRGFIPILFITLLFGLNTLATNEKGISQDDYQFYDIVAPFPNTPNETINNMLGDIILANYNYSEDDSHLNYTLLVYENLPDVENPTATILRGFTRGLKLLDEREIGLNNISATYVKLDADTPVKSRWNAIAFEYKSNVYVWTITFESKFEVGNEEQLFFLSLDDIKFK